MAANRTHARRGPARSRGRAGSRRPRLSAATADKYALYQEAVQSPEVDVAFLCRVYRRARGREPLHLREDFCGTALLSSHWLKRSTRHAAEGFDIDPEPVAWGLAHNFADMTPNERSEALARFTFHLKDVREPGHRPPDVRVALNFSYWVFKQRPELVEYFRAARASLAEAGVFVIDLYGGSEASEPVTDKRRFNGFTYIWEQQAFWPGTGDYHCRIRFRFPDKSEIAAFRYRWRLWSLCELRDALHDAGFTQVDSYFEGTDEDGMSGDGVFRRGVRGENCPAWLAYLVARD